MMLVHIAGAVRRSRALLVGAATLLVIQPLVPVDAWLARPDLGPWLALVFSVAACLRGRGLLDEPHRMLAPRRSFAGQAARRLLLLLLPWALLGCYDVGRHAVAWTGMLLSGDLPFAVVGTELTTATLLTGAAAVAWGLAQTDGRTAWQPRASRPGRLAAALAAATLAGVTGLGIMTGLAEIAFASSRIPPGQLGTAALLGVGFFAVSVFTSRLEAIGQRRAAGRRDDLAYDPEVYSATLALSGPSVVLVGFVVGASVLPEGFAFHQGFVLVLHVFLWAGVLWPARAAIARACILHEVVPTGGAETSQDTRAVGFEAPPEGALRINPLQVRRLGVQRVWMVPVEGARVRDLDDPIRPLWEEPRVPPGVHALGTVAFEVEGGVAQDEIATIHLPGPEALRKLWGGGAQTRRLVVLRAFALTPAESVQALDTATVATLRDGDVIVLTTEGVGRAFAVEWGERIGPESEWEISGVPQVEDYVRVAT